MATWGRFLTERDQAVRNVFLSKPMGFRKRPVLMVIDVNENFTGDREEPILESIKRFRNSCGAEGWRAAESIAILVEAARAKRLPIIYTTEMDQRADGSDSGRWADKTNRVNEDRGRDLDETTRLGMHEIDGKPGYLLRGGARMNPRIAPRPGDIIIPKMKPSAFFGTFLASYLVDLAADTLLVTGCTTSGCVRATVIDGFSYNYRIAVIEEGVFDRFEASHAMTLYDIEMKYGDVVTLARCLDFVTMLPDGLFDEQLPSLRGHALVTPAR